MTKANSLTHRNPTRVGAMFQLRSDEFFQSGLCIAIGQRKLRTPATPVSNRNLLEQLGKPERRRSGKWKHLPDFRCILPPLVQFVHFHERRIRRRKLIAQKMLEAWRRECFPLNAA